MALELCASFFNTLRRGKRKKAEDAIRFRINNQIRAKELRVIDSTGDNLGVLPVAEAIRRAEEQDLDLVEIAPTANPPVAKIGEYGKFLYEEKKKQQAAKRGAKSTETKNIQVKIGTGEHDLQLKARRATEWLKEGHRVKVELFLAGRAKYLDKEFHKERLERVLRLISEDYKVSEPLKKVPKGLMITLEKAK